jgi:hypothetical protein
MTDRRTFLKALAASGAVTLLPDTAVFGRRPVTKLNVPGGAIDVHHHFQPPGMSAGNRPWTPELTLAQMEKFNIGVSMLSMTQNGNLLYDNTPKGRSEIRRGNDYGADLVRKHPGKWYFDVAHATFPWPFAAAKAFMPESHLLFGTDYSPEPIESTVNELPGLKLPRQFELALLRGNAERLFPKFKLKT